MTSTTPERRITLQRSQRGLTEAKPSSHPVCDPTSTEVVGAQLDPNGVTGKDADEVLPELSGDVGQDFMAVLQSHLEHRVRQGGSPRPRPQWHPSSAIVNAPSFAVSAISMGGAWKSRRTRRPRKAEYTTAHSWRAIVARRDSAVQEERSRVPAEPNPDDLTTFATSMRVPIGGPLDLAAVDADGTPGFDGDRDAADAELRSFTKSCSRSRSAFGPNGGSRS